MTELLLDTSGTDFPPPRADRPSYHVRLATTQVDVVAAQRLRFEVFDRDGGGSTPGPAGLDADEFDDRCDHLIVWYQGRSGPPRAVATYRLLPPHSNDASPRGAGLRADREFGLMPLERLLDSAVEIGRACVHSDHRNGAAVALLWSGATRYLHLTGYRYLVGCGSVTVDDGGGTAAAFWDLALAGHLAPAERRCRPRDPIPIGRIERVVDPRIPALLHGSLRLGAKVCGPPSYNDVYDTADFLLLLDMHTANQLYRRRRARYR